MNLLLDPAKSIIDLFDGVDNVMAITGASRTRVYRWTQPKERGGTGGFIPTSRARKLLQHAKANDIAVSADQFLMVGEAAE